MPAQMPPNAIPHATFSSFHLTIGLAKEFVTVCATTEAEFNTPVTIKIIIILIINKERKRKELKTKRKR